MTLNSQENVEMSRSSAKKKLQLRLIDKSMINWSCLAKWY